MIKEYSFKETPFQTIIIPKGTVLFRGLNYDEESHYMSIFNVPSTSLTTRLTSDITIL